MTNQEFIAYAMRRAAEYDPQQHQFIKVDEDLPITAAEEGVPPKWRRTAFFRVQQIGPKNAARDEIWPGHMFFVWELYRIEMYATDFIERAGEGTEK